MNIMNTIKKIEKGLNVFCWIFNAVGIVALTFCVLVIVYDVFCRFVLKSAMLGSVEYVSLSEVVFVFLALAYTHHNHGLVHITFFMRKLPKLSPVIVWTINEWLGTAVVVLLTYASWLQSGVVKKLNLSTTSLLIPLHPFHVVMTVGFFAYAVVQLFSAIKSTIAIFNKEVREDLIANWPA